MEQVYIIYTLHECTYDLQFGFKNLPKISSFRSLNQKSNAVNSEAKNIFQILPQKVQTSTHKILLLYIGQVYIPSTLPKCT